MKVFLNKIAAVFFVLCMIFIPLNFVNNDFQLKTTKFLFQDLILFLENIFFENAIKNIDFSSDTISLNLLVLVLMVIAVSFVFLLQIILRKRIEIILISKTAIAYYLAFVLLKYGFDKIFKSQFYLPEPNILYFEFKDLSRDILYWSTIGTSRFYNIALGIIEVFTAVLLLINRTRIVGHLIAIGVFINVILINFGFDISVKTFSILLLSMAIWAVSDDLKLIFDFFIRRKKTQLATVDFHIITSKPIHNGIKTFIIGTILIIILVPYFENQNFNDDNVSRPFLHGIYNVIDSDSTKNPLKINRVFIHRKNYLILENSLHKKVDYYFEIDSLKKQLKLSDYRSKTQIINFNYSSKDSVLELVFPNFKIIAKAENWRKSKVLQNDFHWTIDAIE